MGLFGLHIVLLIIAPLSNSPWAYLVSYVYKFQVFNIECRNETMLIETSNTRCAMICSSALCAGYIYNSTSGQCRICPGDQVANLTFGPNKYKLRVTKETTFACDTAQTRNYDVPLPYSLPLGSVVYVSIQTGNDFGVWFESNDSRNVNFVFNPRFSTHYTALNSKQDNLPWDNEIPLSTSSLYQVNKVYEHWFLVASDGYHIYINKIFYYVFPHRYALNVIKGIRTNGTLQSLIVKY